MKFYFSLILTFLIVTFASAQSFFEKSDAFFSKYVADGAVDYKSISANEAELNSLVQDINTFSLTSKSDQEVMAFYINAYNILVIRGVVDHYPLKSPLDSEGFFDKRKYDVAGEKLTLNGIENQKLREVFNDARIHFVLVCAAQSCPKITNRAITPENLEQILDERTKISLNDPDFIQVDHAKKKAGISEIFKWYKEDFGGSSNFRDFLNQYRKEKIPEAYAIDHYPYDWSLNEKK